MSLALFFAQHVSNASTFTIPEQNPGETNPLFQTAINPQPPHSTRTKQWCLRLHKDTTSPQTNHTVMPTHVEPEQYTHTQLQAPEDECTSIRNMLSKK